MKEMKDKGKTMVQWINLLWYNSFVDSNYLHMLCEKTGVIAH